MIYFTQKFDFVQSLLTFLIYTHFILRCKSSCSLHFSILYLYIYCVKIIFFHKTNCHGVNQYQRSRIFS